MSTLCVWIFLFFCGTIRHMAAPELTPENITQELYKRNVELAVKNKTLSLLSKLYEISILTLEPTSLAKRITEVVRTDLDFDLVGIFVYTRESDELVPLYFAKSGRLVKALGQEKQAFDALKVSDASRHALFGVIFSGSGRGYTEHSADVWGEILGPKTLAAIEKNVHLRAVLVYPLTVENRNVLGGLLIGLNRPYESLGEFGQEILRNVVNVIAIALDKALLYRELQIANQKLAESNERLEELDKMKSEFVGLAGHQLRAPLTVIKGYVSLIMEGTIDGVSEKAKEALGKVQYSTDQLVKLVSSLLDLSRIESGKIKYELALHDFSDLVKEVIDKFGPNAKKKSITVVYENKLGPAAFIFDADKIREAVVNYIDNAIKYSDRGEARVTLTPMQGPDGAWARLEVRDSGIGIKQDDIWKLFSKFSRTDEAKQRDPNGMGIGLYFAKRVAQDHGGNVGAFSEGAGKGSTFWMELPMMAKDKKQAD